jgi:hypothetical protein
MRLLNFFRVESILLLLMSFLTRCLRVRYCLISIVRIFFANVADEDFLIVIPTLEVPACQCCELLSRRLRERFDIFLSNITDAFVFGTAMFVSESMSLMSHFKTYTTL